MQELRKDQVADTRRAEVHTGAHILEQGRRAVGMGTDISVADRREAVLGKWVAADIEGRKTAAQAPENNHPQDFCANVFAEMTFFFSLRVKPSQSSSIFLGQNFQSMSSVAVFVSQHF
jgi:hypothetical protein